MRSRSRRGSMECILEDAPAGKAQGDISGSKSPAPSGNRRRSVEGLRGRSRRGSGASETQAAANAVLVGSGGVAGSGGCAPGMFTYWMQVHVHPPVIGAIFS